jgi:hypothetical protein
MYKRDKLKAEIYYIRGVPVLELRGSPRENGFYHGYLLAPEIKAARDNFVLVMHTLLRQSESKDVPEVLDRVRANLPEKFVKEMQGMCRGYNVRMAEIGHDSTLSFDDALLMHLIPDSKHINLSKLEQTLYAAACTCILKRSQGGVVFGRAMDWLAFGTGGESSILIVWKQEGVASLTVPGLIGVVTGWNHHGLVAAMNVCPGESTHIRPASIPAIFNNRMILEARSHCNDFLSETQIDPIGPYHLTLADEQGHAVCISYFQGADHKPHFVRTLPENDSVMTVVNWCYPKCQGGSFNSQTRVTLLSEYFAEITRNYSTIPVVQQIITALALKPYINSWITVHSCVFDMRVKGDSRAYLKWNNSFAGSDETEQLQLRWVFRS